MPRPQLTDKLTSSNVARELGMGIGQLINWIEHNVLPPPTFIDENGVRYFDQAWLSEAREIVRQKKG